MNAKNPLARIPSRAVSRYQPIDFPQRGSSARSCDGVAGSMKVEISRPATSDRIIQADGTPDDLAIVIPQALATCGRLFARLHTDL